MTLAWWVNLAMIPQLPVCCFYGLLPLGTVLYFGHDTSGVERSVSFNNQQLTVGGGRCNIWLWWWLLLADLFDQSW
jgi:hypothetical protein